VTIPPTVKVYVTVTALVLLVAIAAFGLVANATPP